jgi:hypothetical protein
LVRRKSNNSTPHKQRDSLSTSPTKQAISSPVVNIPSPHKEVAEPVEQSKNDTGDITAAPVEMDTQLDESEYANRRILMRQLLTPRPIDGEDNWGIPLEPETECDQNLQVL